MTLPPMPPSSGPPWPNQYPPQHSGPPPKPRPNRKPWLFVGVSLFAVVALVVGLLAWRETSLIQDAGTGEPSQSANETNREIGLLREKDPLCDDWHGAVDKLKAETAAWSKIDDSIPATSWTPEQRRTYEDAGKALIASSDRFESVLAKAENAVIQELVAQTVVYMREFVKRIPNYQQDDGPFASVATNFSNAVTYMCSSVPLAPAGTDGESSGNSSVPSPAALTDFMPERDAKCDEFSSIIDHQNTVLSGWADADATTPAAQWTEKQKALNNAARKVIEKSATQLEGVARMAQDRIMGDLILAQTAYMKAYADSIPTYTPDDNWLWRSAVGIGGGLIAACEAHQ